MWKNTCKLLLFDLDGTLLQSDKTISKRNCLSVIVFDSRMDIGISLRKRM